MKIDTCYVAKDAFKVMYICDTVHNGKFENSKILFIYIYIYIYFYSVNLH